MEYKRFIIINLAFLIIYGKLLKYIFEKMQKGVKSINIDNFHLEYSSINNTSNVANIIVQSEAKVENILNFYFKFISMEKQNLTLQERQKYYSVNIENILYNNEFCRKIKILKIKILVSTISLIIIVNYIIFKGIPSWRNFEKIKVYPK